MFWWTRGQYHLNLSSFQFAIGFTVKWPGPSTMWGVRLLVSNKNMWLCPFILRVFNADIWTDTSCCSYLSIVWATKKSLIEWLYIFMRDTCHIVFTWFFVFFLFVIILFVMLNWKGNLLLLKPTRQQTTERHLSEYTNGWNWNLCRPLLWYFIL